VENLELSERAIKKRQSDDQVRYLERSGTRMIGAMLGKYSDNNSSRPSILKSLVLFSISPILILPVDNFLGHSQLAVGPRCLETNQDSRPTVFASARLRILGPFLSKKMRTHSPGWEMRRV